MVYVEMMAFESRQTSVRSFVKAPTGNGCRSPNTPAEQLSLMSRRAPSGQPKPTAATWLAAPPRSQHDDSLRALRAARGAARDKAVLLRPMQESGGQGALRMVTMRSAMH